ncbi:MAG: hypothetical protein ACP5NY_04095 [Thermocladium sp.]
MVQEYTTCVENDPIGVVGEAPFDWWSYSIIGYNISSVKEEALPRNVSRFSFRGVRSLDIGVRRLNRKRGRSIIRRVIDRRLRAEPRLPPGEAGSGFSV